MVQWRPTALIGNCYVCSSLEQPPHRGQVICHLCPPPEQTRCDAQAEDRRSVFVDVIDVLRARQALEPGVDSLQDRAENAESHFPRELFAQDHIDLTQGLSL